MLPAGTAGADAGAVPGVRAQGGREPGLALTRLYPVSSTSSGEEREMLEEPKTCRLFFLSAAALGWSRRENTVPHGMLNVGISAENSVHY